MTENSMIKYAETVLVSGVNIQKGQYLIISCPIPAREIAHVIAKKAYDLGAKRVYIDWRDFEFNKIRVEKEDVSDLTSLFDFEIEARNSFIEKDVCRVAIVCENPDLFVGVDRLCNDISRILIWSLIKAEFQIRINLSDFIPCNSSDYS